jgi:hypothetical protein
LHLRRKIRHPGLIDNCYLLSAEGIAMLGYYVGVGQQGAAVFDGPGNHVARNELAVSRLDRGAVEGFALLFVSFQ